MSTPRRWPIVVIMLLALLVPGYWWLFLESGSPSGTYEVDLAEVRRLASAIPGEKPTELRFEHAAGFEFPSVAVVAGDGWSMTKMPVYAYQLVSPTHRTLVDTAMDEATSKAGGGVFFDAEATARIGKGLENATNIVVTHEHFDHLAGLAMHPNAKALLAKTALTVEQLAEPSRMDPLVFPKAALEGYQPLKTEKLHAVAPGVVLIKAPGHTPGAQLVYVQRADGTEVLFIGDVAWHFRNVELVRERARLVTALFLKEDRNAILEELTWLHRVHEQEPALHIVPGHDGEVIDALTSKGVLTKGFAL